MITKEELVLENKILNKVNILIDKKIFDLKKEVKEEIEDIKEFKKIAWSNFHSMDKGDISSLKIETKRIEDISLKKDIYYKKLKQINNKPYFASLIFKDLDNYIYNIYISLTYVKDNKDNIILYDWRSPICSLFYDYEVGDASYNAPIGEIRGHLLRKRQYKIENRKLIGVFDNSLNIDDEFLQDILATNSSNNMKNVVNTIQVEQNKVIRNLDYNNLIVNGIAGSGKTTVALHRIAYLLYHIKNLKSNNILIFSPNNIFSEYISDVLPSLGEENTLQTTFKDYIESQIDEYKYVESFADFIARYYTNSVIDYEVIKYKQSDKIIYDLNLFLEDFIDKACFINDIKENSNFISVTELNSLLKDKYNKFPLYNRLLLIAEKLSERFYKSSKKEKLFLKLLEKNINFSLSIKNVLISFFESKFFGGDFFKEDIKRLNDKNINYEDALLYVYIKGILDGFLYERDIKQIVIDEAQDYNYLQYIIISNIFKKADFTILGDVNQNINPYYKYDSLNKIASVFEKDSKYIELNKTYRSSKEIIDYTNKILNLNHVCAIRKSNNKEIVVRKGGDLKNNLLKDLNYFINNYNKVAIITKDIKIANELYSLLNEYINISLVEENVVKYNKKLIIIPSYLSKGLEFDATIIYNDRNNSYKEKDKYLLYVACTRAQHEMFIYN